MPDTDALLVRVIGDALRDYHGYEPGDDEHVGEAEHIADCLVDWQPDHFVNFDVDGWFVEHSMACRLAGTIGTCDYNAAIREIADEPDAEQFGRWRITDIDEGLPSLERA